MDNYGRGRYGAGSYGVGNTSNQRTNRLTAPPSDFEGLDENEIANLLIDWFLENFEDPVQRMPRDQEAEYGYAFVEGGPYDAREVLNDFFYDTVGSAPIEMAAIQLERTSMVWSPQSEVRPYTDYLVTHENAIVTHNGVPVVISGRPYNHLQALADRARRANLTVTKIEKLLSAGIGHNNPPEPIADAALDKDDVKVIHEQLLTIITLSQNQKFKVDEIEKSVELLRQKQNIFKNFLSGVPKGVGSAIAATATVAIMETEKGRALLALLIEQIDVVLTIASELLT